ncbi:MAG: hypothetical protein WBO06_11520 [Gammaproteobacteria bacterium]
MRTKYRVAQKVKRYKMLLASVSILFFLIYIFTLFYISSRSTEHERTVLELRKQTSTLQKMSRELETVRAERDQLVKGRIPELLPVEFDVAIDINEQNIRNIIFTLARNGSNKIYEYRIVLNNETLAIIHPKVEILAFNDVGIQIGMAQISTSDATSGSGRPSLDPGEVRSYTGVIQLTRNEEPRYFLLATSQAISASPERMRMHLGDVISP